MLKHGQKRDNVGGAISREITFVEPSQFGNTRGRILHPGSPEFGSSGLSVIGGTGASSGAWFVANKPVAIPFRLSTYATVYQLGWRNGSGTMADSIDVGIYDTSWVRKISTGSTARSGASSVQWVNVADTALAPGDYYLVGANNGTSANNQVFLLSTASTAVLMAALGLFDSATNAVPLPDPLTNMVAAATITRIPSLLIACRVPFA